MLKKVNNKELQGLHINFELTDDERQILLSAIQQEWFHLLQKLMEEEIRLLNVNLINTNGADETAVIANHRIAKGAAMFYSGLMQRLEEELQIAKSQFSTVGTIGNPEKPQYIDENN